MDTETMIRELRNLQEKHKDDRVFTFGTRWADVCRDVADRLEILQDENIGLRNQFAEHNDAGINGRFDDIAKVGELAIGDNKFKVYIGDTRLYPIQTANGPRILHKFTLIEI